MQFFSLDGFDLQSNVLFIFLNVLDVCLYVSLYVQKWKHVFLLK